MVLFKLINILKIYFIGSMTLKGIPGIEGIDTRALTKVIRQHGTMLGRIVIVGVDK